MSGIITECIYNEIEGLTLTNPQGNLERRQNKYVFLDDANIIVEGTSDNVVDCSPALKNMKATYMVLGAN